MLVIAAMLRYPDDYWSINDVALAPNDFLNSECKKIMKAIDNVVAGKKVPDVPLVLEEIRVSGSDTTAEFVTRLASEPCSVAQAHEYARTVKGLSASRTLANTGAKIIEIAREKRSDYESAMSEVDSLIYKARQVLPPEERSPEAADILERMRVAPPSDSIPITFAPTLQTVTQGYAPGMFWIVGGFSSVGKSAMGVNMALDVLRKRRNVCIMSFEMPSETYMLRFLSVVSGIPARTLRSGVTLPFDHGERLDKARSQLARSNLFIDDTARSLKAIRSKATRLKETKGLDMLMVDFIQNVYVTGDEFGDARATALELQNLAKDLSCTVVGFSQVSNAQAQRDRDGGDKNYYSFKGHGAIRDAGDVGIMLRRDQVQGSPLLNVSIVKNRHDALADFWCEMDLGTGRITETTGELE
jgi:replicative DNA helicase